jgi:tRNA(Arg) A34 adenosine deaminase TadA
MKKALFLVFLIIFEISLVQAQKPKVPVDSIPAGYFVTHSKAELMQKLADLPMGIGLNDPMGVVMQKIEKYVTNYVPQAKYSDDLYAKESIIQTIISFKEGGYGIGAVLIDTKGKIIFKGHNSQIQKHRSDLHAEMTLLTEFEESPLAKDYMNLYVYKPGMVVFSSAEPCPMCLIRLASARVYTRYCCPGPDDGMANRITCLPSSWTELAMKYPCKKGQSAPVLQKIAHLMFFSYLLDGRGPK